MKIKTTDLTWDQFIYPRGAKSQKTISSYMEALSIDAQFPPIKIQKVFNYTDADDSNKIQVCWQMTDQKTFEYNETTYRGQTLLNNQISTIRQADPIMIVDL